MEARAVPQPLLALPVLVGAVVVQHPVDHAPEVGAGQQRQETQEILVPAPWVAAPGHLAGGHIQGREEGGGPMADVVVAAPLDLVRSHGQKGLGTVPALGSGSSQPRTAPAPSPAGTGTAPPPRSPSVNGHLKRIHFGAGMITSYANLPPGGVRLLDSISLTVTDRRRDGSQPPLCRSPRGASPMV